MFVQFHISDYGWYEFQDASKHPETCVRILEEFKDRWDAQTYAWVLQTMKEKQQVIIQTRAVRAQSLTRTWHETFVTLCHNMVLYDTLEHCAAHIRGARERKRVRVLDMGHVIKPGQRGRWINECETLARHEAFLCTFIGILQERLRHLRLDFRQRLCGLTLESLRKTLVTDCDP